MINPGHGFGPSEWQGKVGNCLVAKADRETLDIGTLAAITDCLPDILVMFSEDYGAKVARKC